MTCGCSTNPAPTHGQPMAAKAAMCQTCPHADRNARGDARGCGLLRLGIVDVTTSLTACPIGRHPDANGRIRWLGVEWLGVPEPIRWRLVWALGREPLGLAGCGCLARLKASRAGPWLEPWLEGIQTLRTRLAGFMADWRDAMSTDAPPTPH